MSLVIIGVAITAALAVGAIGWFTVAGGSRAERAARIEQARCRHAHPAGRTPRQLDLLDRMISPEGDADTGDDQP